jgi:hypothetical protein
LKSQSFPREACPELAEGRESTPRTFGNPLSPDSIPAFAGMTGVSKGDPSPNDISIGGWTPAKERLRVVVSWMR